VSKRLDTRNDSIDDDINKKPTTKGPRRNVVVTFTSTEKWSDQHGVKEGLLECNTSRTDPSEDRSSADRDGESHEVFHQSSDQAEWDP
jgi:hypothetical protein